MDIRRRLLIVYQTYAFQKLSLMLKINAMWEILMKHETCRYCAKIEF